MPGGLWPAAPGFLRGTGQRAGRGTARGQPGGAGSYLLQGEGGAVAALLPPQEPVVEVASGVSSEGGRACGPRAALGTASGRRGAAAPAPSPGPGPVPPAHRANRIGQVPKPTIPPLRVPRTEPAELPGRSPPDRGRSGQRDRGCLDAVLTPQHHRESGPDPSSHGQTAPCGCGRCSAPGKTLPGDPGAPSLLSGSPRVAPSRPKAARQRALLEPPQGGEEVWDLCQFSLGMPHAGRCHLPPPAVKTGLQEKKK